MLRIWARTFPGVVRGGVAGILELMAVGGNMKLWGLCLLE